MAKLSAIVAALAAVEGTKPLADELTKSFGAHADVELADLATQFGAGAKSAQELAAAQAQLKTLTEQVAAGEANKARLEKLEGAQRTNLITAAFTKAATENGVQPNAISTALALIDTKSLTVDIDGGKVTGLTKELFEGLKGQHAVLFTPPPAATIPNAPANGGNQGGAKPVYTQADFEAGRVKLEDVAAGKVELKS